MTIDVKKAIDLGFHSYITKPIDVKDFINSIDKIIPNPVPN